MFLFGALHARPHWIGRQASKQMVHLCASRRTTCWLAYCHVVTVLLVAACARVVSSRSNAARQLALLAIFIASWPASDHQRHSGRLYSHCHIRVRLPGSQGANISNDVDSHHSPIMRISIEPNDCAKAGVHSRCGSSVPWHKCQSPRTRNLVIKVSQPLPGMFAP